MESKVENLFISIVSLLYSTYQLFNNHSSFNSKEEYFMKSSLGLILFLLFSFSISNAQTNQNLNNSELNTFNINFINGYAISYNYLSTENFWLRAQLDLFLTANDFENETERYYRRIGGGYYGSRNEGTENSDNKYLGIALSTQIILPIYKSDYGFIYFGVGPQFSYNNESRFFESELENFTPDTILIPTINRSSNEIKNKFYDLGIIGLLGISASITDNICLYAETHFSGGLRWSDLKTIYRNSSSPDFEDVNESTSTGNGWFYEARFVRIGVTISI